jgi:hypothetical protein
VVVTHSGVKLPYQLHICPAAEATLELRSDDATLTLDDERKLELRLIDERTLETELDLALELKGTLELAGATLEATAPVHTAPAITGIWALLLPLVPCTPNSILEPTAILLFQFNGEAV